MLYALAFQSKTSISVQKILLKYYDKNINYAFAYFLFKKYGFFLGGGGGCRIQLFAEQNSV